MDDQVQLRFLAMLGAGADSLSTLLAANLADMQRANANVQAYAAPGSAHTILPGRSFHTLEVDGVSFRDWVAALLDGKPLADVGSLLQAATK